MYVCMCNVLVAEVHFPAPCHRSKRVSLEQFISYLTDDILFIHCKRKLNNMFWGIIAVYLKTVQITYA